MDEPTSTAADFPVVALCASAGGIDALGRVLAPLPADFPAAIIALQHVSPQHLTLLPVVLQRSSKLRVRTATDRDELRPGEVLVVPPGQHMLVGRDARIRLVAAGPLPPARPSADLLLCTLAVSLGPRVTAVILTGSGRDGSIGAQAVHAYGGRILVQDPETAMAPGMPQATMDMNSPQQPPLALDAIGPCLIALMTNGRAYEAPVLDGSPAAPEVVGPKSLGS